MVEIVSAILILVVIIFVFIVFLGEISYRIKENKEEKNKEEKKEEVNNDTLMDDYDYSTELSNKFIQDEPVYIEEIKMKYFNSEGKMINTVNISSLTKEGYREYSQEIASLKERGISLERNLKLQSITKVQKKVNITHDFIKNPNADNCLYYFKFILNGKPYYKLGITSQTLKERYGKEYVKIDKILYNEKIDNAIKIEKKLKEEYKDNIHPLKYFNDSGHTEIFDKDILELDIEI
ncbi:MAG: hypothetical protein M0R46_16310 [Candidatus Muirbacterium halophilum]|nr:hypothetical protein [Candidatus Muirbacterium halophilum]